MLLSAFNNELSPQQTIRGTIFAIDYLLRERFKNNVPVSMWLVANSKFLMLLLTQ